MKNTTIKTALGAFTITENDGEFRVFGSIKAARAAFRAIHRVPPDKFGLFWGREKAAAAACRELIEQEAARHA